MVYNGNFSDSKFPQVSRTLPGTLAYLKNFSLDDLYFSFDL